MYIKTDRWKPNYSWFCLGCPYSVFKALDLSLFCCFQSQQDRVHQGQISDVGLRASNALSGGWHSDCKRPQQGEKLLYFCVIAVSSLHPSFANMFEMWKKKNNIDQCENTSGLNLMVWWIEAECLITEHWVTLTCFNHAFIKRNKYRMQGWHLFSPVRIAHWDE